MRWLFGLLLVFLVACSASNEIIAHKISAVNHSVDAASVVDVPKPASNVTAHDSSIEDETARLSCDKVICSNNFVCEDGKCVCKGTVCDGFCAVDDVEGSCCSDKDCKSGESCVNHECVADTICGFHQSYNEDSKKCVCNDGYFFCEDQNKCLADGSCCNQGDCDRYSSCVNTVWGVGVCFKYPDKKLCRTLRGVKASETISTPKGEFFIELEGIYEGGVAKIKIGDEYFNIGVDQRISAAKGTVWVEAIKTFGGFCKVEED